MCLISKTLITWEALYKPYAWWRHQMETFSALLAICAGNSPVTGEFPAQRPVTRSFYVFTLICLWINGWVNNREAGDLSRHRSHYDVIVMVLLAHEGKENMYGVRLPYDKVNIECFHAATMWWLSDVLIDKCNLWSQIYTHCWKLIC